MKRPQLMRMPKLFIKSMEVLITRYQEAIKLGISKEDYEQQEGYECLLCNPIGSKVCRQDVFGDCHYHEFDTKCQKLGCPWWVILGKSCTDQEEFCSETCVYTTSDKQVQYNRIRQLRNWIKLYKDYLEKKKLAI